MDEVTLQIPSEPSRSSPDWKAYFDAFTGNTSKTHGWLKWASWSWLRCQGEPEPRYEQPYPGGKGDVYSESLLTIMECGDTAPDKLLSTLVSCSAYSAWILVPYPAEPRFYIQETISGSMLLAYRFRRPD
jgi:hypothetical protein